MKYDQDYYYNLLRLQTEHAQKISEIRWAFVKPCNAQSVLDYGSGVGFFKAFAPSHVLVDTYDIGPYTMTGITQTNYDLVCLWDVLEHLPSIDEQLEKVLRAATWVALSLPILPPGFALETWKHFKPGEHLHYFDDRILDILFKKYGFKRTESGYPECPPRKDIESILYRRTE